MEVNSNHTGHQSAREVQSGSALSSDKGASSSTSIRYAAQPDIVLSEERDSYYANSLLADSASELAETLLGSRRAVILAPELRALTACLYFGLTNFAGKQTLGQEYCDIGLSKAKAGATSSSLSTASLRLYAAVRVLIPYLQERLREGWHGLRSLRYPLGRGNAAATLAAARARAAARAAALAPPLGILASPRPGTEHASTAGAAVTVAEFSNSGGSGGQDEPDRGRSWSAPREEQAQAAVATARLRTRPWALETLARLLSWARRKRAAASGVLEWALRLHLAAFYFDGRFANLAMRAVGTRLAYTRELDEPRTRYPILGVFLLVQALAEAAPVCARVAGRWTRASSAGEESPSEGGASTAGRGSGHQEVGLAAVSLRVPAVTPERTPADAALFPPSRRRCSLCMSPRVNPAATPCGHLFCWECIVGWCQTNPECPLCRQAVAPQMVVCLYQYA